MLLILARPRAAALLLWGVRWGVLRGRLPGCKPQTGKSLTSSLLGSAAMTPGPPAADARSQASQARS